MKGKKTMSKDMLGSLVRVLITVPENRLGLVQDVALKLSNNDGHEWEQPLKQFLRKEPCWINGQVKQVVEPAPTTTILELVSTIVVNATTCKFVANDKFVINTRDDAPVKISYLGENFRKWFLHDDGKIEDPICEQTLRYQKLRQSSVDGPIITELGGEAKAETSLSETFSLMEKQKHGEYGVLLNNGYANIFYIRDQAGVLRAVGVHWGGVGWFVIAGSVGGPFRWFDGGRVFSRNLVLKSSETLVPAQAVP